ncbi:PilZ domain-containing protein, partial [Myxococcota bacterium]|nr:PilZ domain-containing protein [Myxococcota bacterium]
MGVGQQGMTNRRRSERYRIALPVLIKDAHGGEQTRTSDVSAHGIAVLASKSRSLRQYVELELTLPAPSSKLSVTAVVARIAEDLELADGTRGKGFGLDFFLFDAKAKAEWQRFMARLRTEPQLVNTLQAAFSSAAPPAPARPAAPAPAAAAAAPADEEPPTFLIKPRDLGRLWAFFRGEMSKGVVRIETPIAKKVGEPVELLVVHPSSHAEWTLAGKVARSVTHGRGGRPVLEIALVDLDQAHRAAFRSFVATGQGMIEEDIHLHSGDLDEAEASLEVEGTDEDLDDDELSEIEELDADELEPIEDSFVPDQPARQLQERLDRAPKIGSAADEAPHSITIDYASLALGGGASEMTARPPLRAPSVLRDEARAQDEERGNPWNEATEYGELGARPDDERAPTIAGMSALDEPSRPIYALGDDAILGEATASSEGGKFIALSAADRAVVLGLDEERADESPTEDRPARMMAELRRELLARDGPAPTVAEPTAVLSPEALAAMSSAIASASSKRTSDDASFAPDAEPSEESFAPDAEPSEESFAPDAEPSEESLEPSEDARPAPLPDPATDPLPRSLSGRVFASFFFEAAASRPPSKVMTPTASPWPELQVVPTDPELRGSRDRAADAQKDAASDAPRPEAPQSPRGAPIAMTKAKLEPRPSQLPQPAPPPLPRAS